MRYRGFFIPTIREFFEKMLLLIRQCNTCLEEIMMVTKQNYKLEGWSNVSKLYESCTNE